ncbi:hypothetical protein [Streptomyces sp. NPDC097640]|uniref:hypothetical protein n=1 Tax=Streptomyces sp. NPDC097640 TaxID=3157229 RepID=UPI003332EB6F
MSHTTTTSDLLACLAISIVLFGVVFGPFCFLMGREPEKNAGTRARRPSAPRPGRHRLLPAEGRTTPHTRHASGPSRRRACPTRTAGTHD